MPVSECNRCGGEIYWRWEEAFNKWGFDDGDGQIETWQVEQVLTAAGYKVEAETWGLHNTIIISIKKDGHELIPPHDVGVTLGYDDPRDYLPAEIITLLDQELG